MYEVVLSKWVSGQGFSYTETIDTLDECCTANEYIDSMEDIYLKEGQNILIEIRESDTQKVLSEAWYKE